MFKDPIKETNNKNKSDVIRTNLTEKNVLHYLESNKNVYFNLSEIILMLKQNLLTGPNRSYSKEYEENYLKNELDKFKDTKIEFSFVELENLENLNKETSIELREKIKDKIMKAGDIGENDIEKYRIIEIQEQILELLPKAKETLKINLAKNPKITVKTTKKNFIDPNEKMKLVKKMAEEIKNGSLPSNWFYPVQHESQKGNTCFFYAAEMGAVFIKTANKEIYERPESDLITFLEQNTGQQGKKLSILNAITEYNRTSTKTSTVKKQDDINKIQGYQTEMLSDESFLLYALFSTGPVMVSGLLYSQAVDFMYNNNAIFKTLKSSTKQEPLEDIEKIDIYCLIKGNIGLLENNGEQKSITAVKSGLFSAERTLKHALIICGTFVQEKTRYFLYYDSDAKESIFYYASFSDIMKNNGLEFKIYKSI